MNNRKILLYVLSGAWDTPYTDGSDIIGISEDIEPLQEKLQQIIKGKASDYLEHPTEPAEQEIGDRHYEITDIDGRYAKFYITEHYVEISETLMGAISREMEKTDRTNDVKNYLQGLYESDNMGEEEYEKLIDSEEFLQKAVELFDKMEDCNTPFNTTMELAVSAARKETER